MKQLLYLLLTISLISCSNDVSEKNDNNQPPNPNKNPGQTLQLNKSIVLAKIISKEITDEFAFTLKIKTIDVEDNTNYASIAVAGEEYILTPGYYIDENKEIPDNERNRGLKELALLNVGDEFKAEISLEQSEGWIIYKVIK